jgi:hypothetical protein
MPQGRRIICPILCKKRRGLLIGADHTVWIIGWPSERQAVILGFRSDETANQNLPSLARFLKLPMPNKAF